MAKAADAARVACNWAGQFRLFLFFEQRASGSQPRTKSKTKVLEEWNTEAVVLLRHIFGNPFRPYPSPPSWPSTVVQLAESLYAGQDCAFALHDALLEAGHAELAEHFRQETWHPKGCWVMDVILGKE
jgi:hypothetical protein